MKRNTYLLITLVGLIALFVPLTVASLVTVPYTPYIPEGYYSRGVIDYVDAQTGMPFITVLPIGNDDFDIVSAKFEFVEADVTLSLPLKDKLATGNYIQYRFWYDTNVVSDGLQFNQNYTVIITVENTVEQTDSVTDWILFASDNDEPVDELPEGDNGITTDELFMFVPGFVLTSFGLVGYTRRKK